MAEGLAAVLVPAALRGGENEAAVLDGAGALQHMPMRLTGLARKGRWHGEKRRAGFREATIERGKAQVVADGEAEAAPGQVGDDAIIARAIIARLAIALAAGKIDVEHMDLVVARENFAFGIDQE